MHLIYNILETNDQYFRLLLNIHFPSFNLMVTMAEKWSHYLVKYTSIIPQKQRKYRAIILQKMLKLDFF